MFLSNFSTQRLETAQSIARYLAILSKDLYGKTNEDGTAIDHWLDVSQAIYAASKYDDLSGLLSALDTSGRPISKEKSFLVGDKLSVADLAMIGALKGTLNFYTFSTWSSQFLVAVSETSQRILREVRLPERHQLAGQILREGEQEFRQAQPVPSVQEQRSMFNLMCSFNCASLDSFSCLTKGQGLLQGGKVH